MPRTARVTHRGGFYHLYNRSLNKHPVFKNFQDLDYFLKKFAKIVGDGDWTIYAYCIMPTHYYILIEEKKMPVAKFISRLFTSYGVYYNKKYKSLANNIYSIIKSLSYFDDADLKEMPEMIEKINWEEVKEFFRKEVLKLADKYL